MVMTNKDKARRHAERTYVCLTCGKLVCGNGGRSSHEAMHRRRGEPGFCAPGHTDQAKAAHARRVATELSPEAVEYLDAVIRHNCGAMTEAEARASDELIAAGLIRDVNDPTVIEAQVPTPFGLIVIKELEAP